MSLNPIEVPFFKTMQRSSFLRLLAFSLSLFVSCVCLSTSTNVSSRSCAADGDEGDGLILKKREGFSVGELGSSPFGNFGGKSKDPFRFNSSYTFEKDRSIGRLSVTCDLDPGYYVYSVTQPPGGPMRTNITVKSPSIKLTETFQSSVPPQVFEGEVGFENVKVEKHLQQVVWSAAFEALQALDPTVDEIVVSLSGQVCRDGACIPIQNQSIIAVSSIAEAKIDSNSSLLAGAPPMGAESENGSILIEQSNAPPSASGVLNSRPNAASSFKAEKSRTSWQIELSPSVIVPGARVELILTAVTEPPFHLYEVRPTDENIESSTLITITEKSGLRMGMPVPTEPPERVDLIPGKLSVSYHDHQVSWRIPIEVDADASSGTYRIEGKIGYQACTLEACEDPLGLIFRGILKVANSGDSATDSSYEPARFEIESISYNDAAKDFARLTWFDQIAGQGGNDIAGAIGKSDFLPGQTIPFAALFGYFALAMAGGLVLNLMPCVLPVIGLKIMSFVQESKQSKSSATILNLWYVAGILSVFLVLAVTTIVAREFFQSTFHWGSQFGYFGFRLATTILMFAMALSFLGVWEIPIPGFATSDQSSQLMRREGAFGAYFKGLLTTILATPCSGPGLGGVFALTLDQPAWVILLMYFAIGLGMGLPYLLIALNPSLLAYMPKPGAWMQTLKEVLAFPLLLSVVWFLTTFSNDYRIAVVTCLIFVWLACWWIGKVPPWTESKFKFSHWFGATSIAIAGSIFALQFLGPYKNLIDWEPYNESTLVAYRTQGKAVMIDFTAQWCANCKVNLATAIETKRVAEVIRQHGVVPMIADHTDLPEHITKKLEELRSTAIPVLAIYPAGLSSPPIVMRDVVTEQQVIAALRRATDSEKSATSRVTLPIRTLMNRESQ